MAACPEDAAAHGVNAQTLRSPSLLLLAVGLANTGCEAAGFPTGSTTGKICPGSKRCKCRAVDAAGHSLHGVEQPGDDNGALMRPGQIS